MRDCHFQEDKLTLGYFPIRGKAQICRLLCEYLELPYRNLFFTPDTWQIFKKTQHLNWIFQELPFLTDGELTVTETYPISLYLIHKAGCLDLLGRSLQHQAIIEMFVGQATIVNSILSSIVKSKSFNPQDKEKQSTKAMQEVRKKLICLQSKIAGPFYLEYLTLADFYIYEVVNMVNYFYPALLTDFPRICSLSLAFQELPAIWAYNRSERLVSEICPVVFAQKWKQSHFQNH